MDYSDTPIYPKGTTMNNPKIINAEPVEITEEELIEPTPFYKTTKFKLFAAAGAVAAVVTAAAVAFRGQSEDEESDEEEIAHDDFPLPEIDSTDD